MTRGVHRSRRHDARRARISDAGQQRSRSTRSPRRRSSRLVEAGFPVVVITNQGGIALGLYDHAFVDATHARAVGDAGRGGRDDDRVVLLSASSRRQGPRVHAKCDCRKPGTGMVEAAARELNLDLTASWVVGDQWRDIELAHRAGARSVLVRTGYGAGLESQLARGHRPADRRLRRPAGSGRAHRRRDTATRSERWPARSDG